MAAPWESAELALLPHSGDSQDPDAEHAEADQIRSVDQSANNPFPWSYVPSVNAGVRASSSTLENAPPEVHRSAHLAASTDAGLSSISVSKFSRANWRAAATEDATLSINEADAIDDIALSMPEKSLNKERGTHREMRSSADARVPDYAEVVAQAVRASLLF
jgi:hypothetical protein